MGARQARRWPVRCLVRGPHRLSAGRRRDGADQPDRLHAQPPAHGDGELSVKDLGIDWRRGERYFAEKLNDYDLAANNGGWQWAASTGCDAQPYFRIFNPVTQRREVRCRWQVHPALLAAAGGPLRTALIMRRGSMTAGSPGGRRRPRPRLPAPLVDHAEARAKTLAALRRRDATPRRARLRRRRGSGAGSGLGRGGRGVAGDQGEQVFFRVGLAEVVVDAELDGVIAMLLGDPAR